MQIFKTFFKVMKQYKISLSIYTAIIIFMLLMMTTGQKADEEVSLNKYTILVVDNDNSEVSKELVKFLESKHNLKEGTYSDEQIKDMLYYLTIREYIEIPEGFGENFTKLTEASDESIADSLLETTYDDSMPYAIFINMQINQYLNSVKDYMKSGVSLTDASSKCIDTMDTSKFVEMQKKEAVTSEKIYSTFQYLPFGIMTIIFSGVLPVVMSFNESEKKNRTIISSYKMTSRNISLVLGCATIAALVTVILDIIASYRNNGPLLFTTPWYLSIANTFIYTLSITMLLSMITSLPLGVAKKGSANPNSYITCILGLSFSFLGGTFVDLSLLGDKVAKVGQFTPNYWYSVGLKQIWYEGATFNDVAGNFGMQLLFGLVCLSIGLVFTRFFGDNKA